MAKSKEYQKRFYRELTKGTGLIGQEVIVKETDLSILAEKDIKDIAEEIVGKYRQEIEKYIKQRPEFATSLEPISMDLSAPDIIKEMIRASEAAGVGPMAAVAGAIAEFVGKELLKYSGQLIIENGGDIFIKTDKER
ncbi:MAG: UPF0280 family protein, partial [Candidatus Omnitrophota bacterium]